MNTEKYIVRLSDAERRELVTEGFEATLNRKKRRLPPVPKKLDGLQEAQVIATRCGSPPEGFGKWSLRLLANQTVVAASRTVLLGNRRFGQS